MTDHEFKAPKRTITEPSDETTARLAEIRDRANAATEGPWVSGKESECPDCTEPVPDEDGE